MKQFKQCVSLFAAVCMLASIMMLAGMLSVSAVSDTQITAITSESILQGEHGSCSVYIDSLEKLSSLIVTIYFDSDKLDVETGSVNNAAPCILYDKSVKDDSLQFSYIFDGSGDAEKTLLFSFAYSVLTTAEIGETYFDIVVSEAYDSDLQAMPIIGSRCNFSVLFNPEMSHSYTRQVIADDYKKSDATCTTPAVYYYCCETCDSMGDATYEYGEALGHYYDAAWNYNASSHWKKCSVCGETTEYTAHSAGSSCSTCGYIPPEIVVHKHSFYSHWSYNANTHWHDCSGCDSVKDTELHIYENSCDAVCNICGYVRTITHSYRTEWSMDAEKHWYECTVCGDRKTETLHTASTDLVGRICIVCEYAIDASVEWNDPFTDILETDWYFDAVKCVYSYRLMNGTSVSTFSPNEKLTRAMFVTVLYRLEKEPVVSSEVIFNDVDKNSWYTNAVIWAKENNLVYGISENEYAPNAYITREQIATILYRYMLYKGYDVQNGKNEVLLSYVDAGQISEFALPAMKYVVESGLIRGKTESTLNPKDNATRAEIAVVLQRLIESVK